MYTHFAYCLTTSEIFMTTTVNSLKRHCARNAAWDKANGFYGRRQWVFAHGSKGRLLAKIKKGGC